MKKLLVVGGTDTDYDDLFKGCTVKGEPVVVAQSSWDDLHVSAYRDGGYHSAG